MSEQVLTVIGTLGAALLGFIGIIFTNYQNNRYQTEQQEQRYEQEEAARTRERKIELLEELLLLVLKLNEGKYGSFNGKDEYGQTINRVTAIVLLYFDEMQKICLEYIQAHKEVQKIFHVVNKIAADPNGHDVTAEKAKELHVELPIAIKNLEVAFTHFLPEIKEEAEQINGRLHEIKKMRVKWHPPNFFQRMRFRFLRMRSRIQLWRKLHIQKSHK
jgi:hypothetical protein